MKNVIWNSVSDEAKDLVSKLLKRSADERLTASEAMEHVWISK
jgi:hypothetical protein